MSLACTPWKDSPAATGPCFARLGLSRTVPARFPERERQSDTEWIEKMRSTAKTILYVAVAAMLGSIYIGAALALVA